MVLNRDGLVYACDRGSDRIQVFTKAGDLVSIIPVKPGTGVGGLGTAGSAWDVDFSQDWRQTFMFDVDGGNEIVWIFDRAAATILSGFGRPGHAAGAVRLVARRAGAVLARLERRRASPE